VRPALETMLASLDAGLDRLLVATVDGALAGWLLLSCNASPLTDHWPRCCGCRLRRPTAAPTSGGR